MSGSMKLHAANILLWTVVATCAMTMGRDLAALFGMAVAAAFGLHACTYQEAP